MMRALTIVGVIATFVSAIGLYWIKDTTRRLESEVQRQETEIERLKKAVAVSRAERAFLARPERIEQLARERLGMRPLTADQHIDLRTVPLRAEAAGRGAR
jgi:cell division protein FtsL